MPQIEFDNKPRNFSKLRNDSLTFLREENSHKIVSLKILNIDSQLCKLVVKLLLKSPKNQDHFYELCRPIDKVRHSTIEQNINPKQSIIKLDFFGIKKPLKKDALHFIKEHINGDNKSIYENNMSTILVQLSLVDICTGTVYDVITHDLIDNINRIVVNYYTPKHLLYDDNEWEITIVLVNQEKDVELIYLELKIEKTIKIIPKELKKSTTLKNLFVFVIKRIAKKIKNFEARLCRCGPNIFYSDWMSFIVQDKDCLKRNASSDDDEYNFQNKIPRSVSSTISCDLITENDLDLSTSSSRSNLNEISSKKQFIKNFMEMKALSNIARVGHDYAFGCEVTDFMKLISKELPVVYILQDDVGDTPLHNAILKSQEERAVEIIEIVNKHYPNALYTKNTSYHTALILAPACNVSANFVQRLIFNGFDLKDKDIEGNSALSIAIEYKNTNVLEILVKNASAKKIFIDDISEIIFLIRKTIIEKYKEGYKLLIESFLVNDFSSLCLDPSKLNLDSESTKTFNQYKAEMGFNREHEVNIEDYLDLTEYNIGFEELLT